MYGAPRKPARANRGFRGYEQVNRPVYGRARRTAAKGKYVRARYKPGPRYSYQRSTWLAPALRTVGSGVGNYLGGPVLGRMGGQAGAMLGDAIKTMTGFGDYQIKENSLVLGNPPSVMNGALPGGSIIISHKEYLGDVVSSSVSGSFQLRSYNINPGDENTFPWLSQIAGNFQQYKVMGMAFQFRTMSCDALNSTNTALGQVIMATNYDCTQQVFLSKPEMENCEYAQSVKPSESCLHLLECDTSTMPIETLYVRTDEIPAGTDRRMYDMGKFQIATNGFQGQSVNAGELWVTYQIMLLKPKLNDALGEDTAYWIGWNNVSIAASTPLGAIAYWTEPENPQVNTSQVSITSDRIITFEPSAVPRCWRVGISWVGAATGTLVAPTLAYTNCTGAYCIRPTSTQQVSEQYPHSAAGAASTRFYLEFYVRTNGAGIVSYVTLGTGGTLPASCTRVQVQVISIPLDAGELDGDGMYE
ncbi:capsid protein [Crucivirus-148]|nr:capsid protein [Crucivirus-146]QMW68676.1 capsid protein [Crucivirus-147]QMW68678.1 capsid protein [Crucivirus-148]